MSKRLLSPQLNTNTEDKRRRNDSIEIEEDLSSQSFKMEKETTLADLKILMDSIIMQLKDTAKSDDLLTLASKQDIKEIDDRVTAQNEEIVQLREQMKEVQKNLNSLQSTVDGQMAANLTRPVRSVGHDPNFEPGTTTGNMAAPMPTRSQTGDPRRRNLVIEGLQGVNDLEMKAAFIELSSLIGVKVYCEEIDSVVRMTRRDDKNLTPGPVLVSLSRIVLRDNILRKKGNLAKDPELKNKVFVNADEDIEVRRAKSFLRKASYNARGQGEEVTFKHNQVKINSVHNTVDDVHRIPNKYLKAQDDDEGDKADQAMAMDIPTVTTMANTDQVPKEGLIRRGECMKITKKGLCFSGPSAYPSNMAYYDIKVGDKTFVSNEQRFQWEKAMKHDDTELAQEIKDTRDSYEVKNAGGLITSSPEWLQAAPDRLYEMAVNKFEQHPELLERLIDTYPLELIEASKDDEWGGGAPLSSRQYMTVMTPYQGLTFLGKS